MKDKIKRNLRRRVEETKQKHRKNGDFKLEPKGTRIDASEFLDICSALQRKGWSYESVSKALLQAFSELQKELTEEGWKLEFYVPAEDEGFGLDEPEFRLHHVWDQYSFGIEDGEVKMTPM